MKIVYCHNYYRFRGGEDVSFECDVEMLRDKGHSVITFTRDNRQWHSDPLTMARTTVWNRATRRELADLIRRETPDILHCNNLFPQISMSIYATASKARVPIVQALRNYRSFCANSLLYRDGKVCTKCLRSKAAWNGLRYKCYRDSRAATSAVVLMQLTNRLLHIQQRHIDVFFTPTEFSRQIHVDGGFDPASIMVRSNLLVPDPGISSCDSGYALFIGRLSPEKGVDTLLRAWTGHGISIPLRIVGSGPDEDSLKALASKQENIHFLGQLDKANVLDQLAQASFLVMPSRWYETFGRTIAEAFSRGKPVLASKMGAMEELVDEGKTGFLFAPGDPPSLASAVKRYLQTTESQKREMRVNARQRFVQAFSVEASYRQLLDVYQVARQRAHQRRQRLTS